MERSARGIIGQGGPRWDRVPVLLKVVTFEEGGSQGVAFVIDLTERKRAEEVLHKAQAELAHITRVNDAGRDDGLDCARN